MDAIFKINYYKYNELIENDLSLLLKERKVSLVQPFFEITNDEEIEEQD